MIVVVTGQRLQRWQTKRSQYVSLTALTRGCSLISCSSANTQYVTLYDNGNSRAFSSVASLLVAAFTPVINKLLRYALSHHVIAQSCVLVWSTVTLSVLPVTCLYFVERTSQQCHLNNILEPQANQFTWLSGQGPGKSLGWGPTVSDQWLFSFITWGSLVHSLSPFTNLWRQLWALAKWTAFSPQYLQQVNATDPSFSVNMMEKPPL